MTNAIASIGLTYAAADIQRADLGIFLQITEGLNEVPDVRGKDVVVPSLAGQIPRNRVMHQIKIVLTGVVCGNGTTEGDRRADYRAQSLFLRTLFASTRDPANLVAVLEGSSPVSYGHTQTLAAATSAGATVIKFNGTNLATSAAADDIIDTATAHGFVAGQRVMFQSKTGGTGLATGTPYYVIAANLGSTTLQVSLTAGGAAINFTTDITAGVLIPGWVVGQQVRVGAPGEVRTITAIGTSGSGGTGLTLGVALVSAYASGAPIVQVAGSMTIPARPLNTIWNEVVQSEFAYVSVELLAVTDWTFI